MEKFTPEYFLKNILFLTMNFFTLSLTDRIVEFIKRLRWKTYFFLNLSDLPSYQGKEVFNLKTQKTPPSNKLLDPFENDLFQLIWKIKFEKSNLENNLIISRLKPTMTLKTLIRFGFELTKLMIFIRLDLQR